MFLRFPLRLRRYGALFVDWILLQRLKGVREILVDLVVCYSFRVLQDRQLLRLRGRLLLHLAQRCAASGFCRRLRYRLPSLTSRDGRVHHVDLVVSPALAPVRVWVCHLEEALPLYFYHYGQEQQRPLQQHQGDMHQPGVEGCQEQYWDGQQSSSSQ